jgi:hypothetical protein
LSARSAFIVVDLGLAADKHDPEAVAGASTLTDYRWVSSRWPKDQRVADIRTTWPGPRRCHTGGDPDVFGVRQAREAAQWQVAQHP